jgi:hypothetical protein
MNCIASLNNVKYHGAHLVSFVHLEEERLILEKRLAANGWMVVARVTIAVGRDAKDSVRINIHPGFAACLTATLKS